MTTVRQALIGIIGDAAELELDYAIVGGLAVSTWAEPRTTRDVDLAISVGDDTAAEQVVFSLQQRGYAISTIIEQRVLGRLATARLRPPGGQRLGALVDLLFASSGVEAEIVRAASRLEILRGVVAPVASVGHLITMKLLSYDDDQRPQDTVDLAHLVQRATPEDLDEARGLAERIMTLGTNRGRTLPQLLAQAVERWPRPDVTP